jgi:hypothetical protein
VFENLLKVISTGWQKYVRETGEPLFPFGADYFVMEVDIFPANVLHKEDQGTFINFVRMYYIVRCAGSVVL